MNVNVDFLLRSAVRILSSQKCAEPVFAGSVEEARAAVAELMAANENLIELCQQIMRKPAENQELQDAIAALARCKGEK